MNYTEKLWASSNVITAFVVLQSVGFVTFAADSSNTALFDSRYVQIVCVGWTLGGMLAYPWAILRCRNLARTTADYNPTIWGATTKGRVSAIIAFHILVFLAIGSLAFPNL